MSRNSNDMLRLLALLRNCQRGRLVVKSLHTPTPGYLASARNCYSSGCTDSSSKLTLVINPSDLSKSLVYTPFDPDPVVLSDIYEVYYRYHQERGEVRTQRFKEHFNHYLRESELKYPKTFSQHWRKVLYAYPNGVGTYSDEIVEKLPICKRLKWPAAYIKPAV